MAAARGQGALFFDDDGNAIAGNDENIDVDGNATVTAETDWQHGDALSLSPAKAATSSSSANSTSGAKIDANSRNNLLATPTRRRHRSRCG